MNQIRRLIIVNFGLLFSVLSINASFKRTFLNNVLFSKIQKNVTSTAKNVLFPKIQEGIISTAYEIIDGCFEYKIDHIVFVVGFVTFIDVIKNKKKELLISLIGS